MPASIEYRGVSVVAPNGDRILDDVTLRIGAGESVAFIGRSGAGKTTALRLVNGLAKPAGGELLVDGVPLARHDLVALRRTIGYIIQGSGLFPHRTVFENVATVPRLLGWSEERTRAAAREMMARLNLPFEKFATRRPRSLSGGEQQRVGIARALIAEPAVLLCDEPFGALDPIVRRELQDAFRAIRTGATVIFVTHDLAEAMRVARRIVLFDGGRVIADAPAVEFTRLTVPLAQQFVASSA